MSPRPRGNARVNHSDWVEQDKALRAIHGALVTEIEQHGVRGFAKLAGVAPSYITQIRYKVMFPGPKVLKALGFRKVVKYERV